MAVIRDNTNFDNTANYIATLALFCGISCTVLMLKFLGFKASLNFASGSRTSTEYYEDVPAVSMTGAYRANTDEFFVDNTANYIATLALFCGISCTVLMLKFLGFKASLNFASGSRTSTEYYEDVPAVSMTGAYRANTDEFFGYGSLSEPPKKITPSMVKLPPSSQPNPSVRPSKSTNNLTEPIEVPENLRKSTPNISSDPRGVTEIPPTVKKVNIKDAKKQEKEQKKLDKKRIEEQKKRDRLAAQEQAKRNKLAEQEKVKKDKQRIEREKIVKKQAKGKKDTAPAPQRANPLAQGSSLYPTNTLDSSISRTSGPPPYTETSKPEVVQNKNDNTGNTSFGKPVDNSASSWDMVTQHRKQISRPLAAGSSNPKQMVMDLQYNAGRASSSSAGKNNSEA